MAIIQPSSLAVVGAAIALAGCSGDVAGFAAYDDLITGPRAGNVGITFVADPSLGNPETKSVTTSSNGSYSTSLKTGRYWIDFADAGSDVCPGVAGPDGKQYLVVNAGQNTANICIDQ